MENKQIDVNKKFTFIFTKSDVEIIITGLGELPSKYSHSVLTKIEEAMIEQSKKQNE